MMPYRWYERSIPFKESKESKKDPYQKRTVTRLPAKACPTCHVPMSKKGTVCLNRMCKEFDRTWPTNQP